MFFMLLLNILKRSSHYCKEKSSDYKTETEGEVEDWLVLDSRGFSVAVAPDHRGSVALVHTGSRRGWIDPKTSDVTAQKEQKRRKTVSQRIWSQLIPTDGFCWSIFSAHTWGAPGSCGPGWDEDFLSGPAPAASGEGSQAKSPQSARCSSSQHTDEVTKNRFGLNVWSSFKLAAIWWRLF